MDQLMQKLIKSKAIMDKSDGIKRGSVSESSLPNINVESFDSPEVKYNIPQEFMQESKSVSGQPIDRPLKTPTVDAIKNSKLPDEIKRLMIERPIQSQQLQTPTLSNELIERASRLMKEQKEENVKPQKVSQSSNIDIKQIQQIVESTVRKVLQENNLITESEEKSDEVFSFKVGKHVFEGKVTKIKKIR
jgi:hypothetical protein